MTPGIAAGLGCALWIALLVLLPGVALWVGFGLDRRHRGVAAWAVAATLGFAFWPLVLVATGAAGLTVGRGSLLGVLVVAGGVILARARRLSSLTPRGLLEGLGVLVVGVVFATRLWVALRLPIPAWVDGLHHVLLTARVATDGALPADLGPLYPQIPTEQYHLGLHGLAGLVALGSGVAPHTAVLWTSQVANALTAAGVWAFLRPRAGRFAALVGAATVGLFAHFPALFVSWGRYPQTTAQALLPVAWLLAWDALAALGHVAAQPGSAGARRLGLVLPRLGAALLTAAGVMAIHLRVGIFLLLAIAAAALCELVRAARRGAARHFVGLLVGAGLLLLGALGPRVWRAATVFVWTHWELARARGSLFASASDPLAGIESSYFGVALRDVPYLVASPLLLAAALVVGGFGALCGDVVCRVAWLWIMAMLGLMGAAHLGIPLLALTNEGGVLIALHLGLALLLGGGSREILRLVRAGPARWRLERAAALVLVSAALTFAPRRAWPVEGERFLVTHEDLAAYRWIEEHTPPSARFAINTTFWLPGFAHGTDGGWWIPYFAGRRVVPGPMITSLAPGFREWNVAVAHLIERLSAGDESAAHELMRARVGWVYVGERGDPSGPALDSERLARMEAIELVYRSGRVAIFRLRPPPGSPQRRWLESREGRRIMAEAERHERAARQRRVSEQFIKH